MASDWREDMRATILENRFQVGDEVCGIVDGYERKAWAIEAARKHRDCHAKDGDPQTVHVHDVMHRRNCKMTRFEARADGSDIWASKFWS
jgi:hypothetical protein